MTTITRSIRTAIKVAALTAVFMTIGVSPAAGQSQEEVMGALQDSNVAVNKLTVTHVEGIVILKGRVTSPQLKTRAEEVVRAKGYGRVANLIQVVPVPDDELLAREAERQLYLTRGLEGSNLRVSVHNGSVTLEGTVEEELQKDLARVIVGRIDGVREVRTELTRS